MTTAELKHELFATHPDTNGGNCARIGRLTKLITVLRGKRCPVCAKPIGSPARSPSTNRSQTYCSSVCVRIAKYGRPAALLGCLLLICGCAVKPSSIFHPPSAFALPPLPDGPGYLAKGPIPVDAITTPHHIRLAWEHDAAFASGFQVERSTNCATFVAVGFVDVLTRVRTNLSDFTYEWSSTNEPGATALYRVGALPQ